MGAGAAYAGWRKTAQTWRSGAASTAGPEGTTFPGPPAGPCERRTPHTASPADQPNQLVPADTPTRTRPTPRSSGRPHASHVPAHIPPGAGTSQSRASAPTPPGRRSPASSRPGRDGGTGLPWYDGGSPPPWRSRACGQPSRGHSGGFSGTAPTGSKRHFRAMRPEPPRPFRGLEGGTAHRPFPARRLAARHGPVCGLPLRERPGRGTLGSGAAAKPERDRGEDGKGRPTPYLNPGVSRRMADSATRA